MVDSNPDIVAIKNANIGYVVTLGNYRNQDIEWIVLYGEDDKKLIMSKDCIDTKFFGSVQILNV